MQAVTCSYANWKLHYSDANIKLPSSIWAPSSEFVSSSIPSWQILTAHAQPFRGARDLAFCLKVPLDSLFVWASSEGSGETARMRRLAWTFAARIGDNYQIRLTRSISLLFMKMIASFELHCTAHHMNIKLWKSCENRLCFELKNQTFQGYVINVTSSVVLHWGQILIIMK